MQTVTSNTTQQINSALFALDKDIKNIEGNMDLQTQILNEAQTRSNADTALANSINNVSSELSQAQLTAYAYGESGSAATAVTQVITISGSTSYNAAAGSRVLVSFPNGYTPSNEDSELQLQIGNMAALPALAQGVAMKYGSVPAGAMIEFTYTGSAWCCQSNIVKATSDYTLYADGSKIQLTNTRNTWTFNISTSEFGLLQLDIPPHTVLNAQFWGNLAELPSSMFILFVSTDSNSTPDTADIETTTHYKYLNYENITLSFSYSNTSDSQVSIYVKSSSYTAWSQTLKYFLTFSRLK